VIALLALPALGAGFSVETRYASAGGADAWGSLAVTATTEADVHTGALLLGGTRSAVLGAFGGGAALGPFAWDATAYAGMVRTTGDLAGGPTGGGSLSVGVDPGVPVRVGGGYVWGIGAWLEGGAEPALSPRLALLPRLRLDTWSGERDPALRAGIGVQWTSRGGTLAALSASAGGRDVVHLGPGVTLSLGRLP
jgi:hypothetical protein